MPDRHTLKGQEGCQVTFLAYFSYLLEYYLCMYTDYLVCDSGELGRHEHLRHEVQ